MSRVGRSQASINRASTTSYIGELQQDKAKYRAECESLNKLIADLGRRIEVLEKQVDTQSGGLHAITRAHCPDKDSTLSMVIEIAQSVLDEYPFVFKPQRRVVKAKSKPC